MKIFCYNDIPKLNCNYVQYNLIAEIQIQTLKWKK
jgi:hypothetical protein